MDEQFSLNEPTISMFYFSLLAFIWIRLTVEVVRIRRREGIGIGTGGNELLAKKIRCHGNFNEALIPFSLLFVVADLAVVNHYLLHITGSMFVIGRLLHAYGLSSSIGISKGRFFGSILSWSAILVLAINNLYLSSAALFN
jgi:uncharacterized protein